MACAGDAVANRRSGVGISRQVWGKPPSPYRSLVRGGWLLVLAVFFPGPSAGAPPRAGLRDADYLDSARVGFRQIYGMEYPAARATFSSLEARYPGHPGPPLGVATAIWLQELLERQDFDLSRFIAPGYFNRDSKREMPSRERRVFFEKIELSQQLSAAVVDREPANRDARFFQGTAEGLLAAFCYTVDRKTLEAFRHAKKAYQLHQALVEEDPGYYDAYVSVGVYEYIVDNLRWYLKWPAKVIGYRGSEERGIDYLETARRKSFSAKVEAEAMLMVIYFREKKLHHALALARSLQRRFARNFLFRLNEAQILDGMGRKGAAEAVYLDVMDRAERGRPNYQKLPLESFRYSLGRRLRRLGRLDGALRAFNGCLESTETPDTERALCHLEAGMIHDQGGRRKLAVAHYRETLALPRLGDSHQIALRHLRIPYGGK